MRGWATAALLASLGAASPASASSLGDYAGNSECGSCHSDKMRSFTPSGMANALETAAECRILRNHPKLRFQEGKYTYEIVRDGDKSVYTVTDEEKSVAVPLAWAFGLGSAGQTYVFERGGQWYESRVTFFNAVQKLDLTLGAQNIHPKNLDEAAGRPMDRTSARECFDCHSTGAVHGNTLRVSGLIPGLQCENCHGPSVQHVQAMKTGDVAASGHEETFGDEHRRDVGFLRGLPPDVGADRLRRAARNCERAVSTVPVDQQQMLRRGGRPDHADYWRFNRTG